MLGISKLMTNGTESISISFATSSVSTNTAGGADALNLPRAALLVVMSMSEYYEYIAVIQI